jgi:hypothetical protein
VGRITGLEDQLEAAGRFYGRAVDLSKVRVKSSPLVLGGATAWTCNDVVRFKAKRAEDVDPGTFIHEIGHVWEHQSGQAQLLKGLVEQAGRLRGKDPYNFGGAAGASRTARLQDLTKESQAMILQEYWRSLQGETADTDGNAFSPEYVADLRRLTEGAGVGSAPAGRRGPASWIDAAAAAITNGVLALLGS